MKTIFNLTVLVSALAGLALSPVLWAQDFSSDKSMHELERSMEANLNWNLQNALLLYYPETKFVVNAKVQLRKVEPRKVLPKLPDALLSKDLTNLPGLPYLPQDLAEAKSDPREDFSLLQQVNENRYEVAQIRVTVLVDNSLSQNDWSFIRRFVNLTANLEGSRGDQVRIEGMDFPEKANFIAPKIEEPPKQVEASPPAATPAPTSQETHSNWFPYYFAAGLATLLITLYLLGMHNIVNRLRGSEKTAPAKTAEPVKNLSEADLRGKEIKSPAPTNGNGAVQQAPHTEELKARTIDVIVGMPGASAKVLNGWLSERGEAGQREAAVVIASISKSLLDLLEPYLGEDNSAALQKMMSQLPPAAIDKESPALLKKFDEEMRQQLLREKYDRDGDALSFLQQMNDEQLFHLLKPLKTGVMAIVLAQLQTERAAKFLSTLEAAERKSVLAAMANLERIPADVYQHIARQLATRANELKTMRHVRANGVEAMVSVLEQLDETTQEETLAYLQTQNLALAEKVNRRFMTFQQLLASSRDKLRQAALEVDRETLAKSLVTLDRATVERIIQSLPPKLAEMVRASLESHRHISETEVSEARRTLMRTLRRKKSLTA
jgi:flagellar motor switch protein FliG